MPVFQGVRKTQNTLLNFFFLTTNKDSSSWGGEGEDDVEDGPYFLYDEDRLPFKAYAYLPFRAGENPELPVHLS